MLTQVRTPQDIFFNPQRLLVPLFQRPYVWNEELQWQPLWNDVRRLTERRLSSGASLTHFLGAVVLQQQATQVGSLTLRTVIDGQQRLTTLQLFFDAVRRQVSLRGYDHLARQLTGLTENPLEYRSDDEERFKVWPTNRDRPAFEEVMSASTPVDYQSLSTSDSRMSAAHEYFSTAVSTWLDEDEGVRTPELVSVLRGGLQIVTIDLQADEDAQEIFETLNARGTPLSAADLIKNFVFQNLDETGAVKIESLYTEHWSPFETPFWEAEVTSGRVIYSRSSLFLNQWLVSKTLVDVPARAVFAEFKHYASKPGRRMDRVLPEIARAAGRYRNWVEGSLRKNGPLSRVELFIYRTAALESEVIRPLLLWLTDDTLDPVPEPQLDKALGVLESWIVRRRLVRVPSQGFNRVVLDLMSFLAARSREKCGDLIEDFLRKQTSTVGYWPSDSELRAELADSPIYRRMSRARLRMILEAVEDRRRGWVPDARRFHESPVVRGTCSIEHLLPQEWRTNWSGPEVDETRRESSIDLLGNLTLVTSALNSKVSNSAWDGDKGKRASLEAFTSLYLTREATATTSWNEETIRRRTERMIDEITAVWPVPAGHEVRRFSGRVQRQHRVEVADLLRIGLLRPGQLLYARPAALASRTCEVSPDGRLRVGDVVFESLSGAAQAVSGASAEAGWDFWLLSPKVEGGQSIATLRLEYVESTEAAAEED